MDSAPKDGSAIEARVDGERVVIGWAHELWKAPPPFLQRPANYEPELLRAGAWRLMRKTDVFGWGFIANADPVSPSHWIGHADA